VVAVPPSRELPALSWLSRFVSFFVETLRIMGMPTQSGVFGAHMVVDIQNDGPVTILLEQPGDLRSSWNF